ncbi:hypothetical protein MRS44_004042 [Fusarium solani]|uniref:uncharacterized protein n=1 Tax=Fusarium solani TaxID=169388 RepID=UPI0032C3EDC2|nr:hypothetical protein MRS44_004042 [Fusarium solani]
MRSSQFLGRLDISCTYLEHQNFQRFLSKNIASFTLNPSPDVVSKNKGARNANAATAGTSSSAKPKKATFETTKKREIGISDAAVAGPLLRKPD